MKIKFLGSSHGVPEADRMWTSVMIAVGENTYLIDAGCFCADGIIRSGRTLDSLKAVFITHQHGDHMNGIISLVDIISWYYKKSDPEIFLPNTGISEKLRDVVNYGSFAGESLRDIRYSVTNAGVIYDDGVMKVTAFPTKHINNGAYPSFAYLCEAEGKRVLFTGDLSRSCEDMPEVAFTEELDLTVIEAAHFILTEREHIFGKVKTKQMAIGHFAPRNDDCVWQFIFDMPFETFISADGMEFDL